MSENELLDEEFVREPAPLWVRVVQAMVALLLVGAFLNWTGLYPHVLLRRTSPEVIQPPIEVALDAHVLTVPVHVFVLQAPEPYGSQRTVSDATRLVTQANTIWNQAQVELSLERAEELRVTPADLEQFSEAPHEFIRSLAERDPTVITVLLTRTLAGVNGIAFGGTNTVAVADYTSVHDFRTLAHEIGHVFLLPHVSGLQNRLMFRGANGVSLTLEEIEQARMHAERFRD